MSKRLFPPAALPTLVVACLASGLAHADDLRGTVQEVDLESRRIVVEPAGSHEQVTVKLAEDAHVDTAAGETLGLASIRPGMTVKVADERLSTDLRVMPESPPRTVLGAFWHNFTHNLFKPLLLFFYMGFLIPIFRVKFEFPYAIYQGLTIYLLIAIGWHGGEELAVSLNDPGKIGPILGFMGLGFVTNTVIGVLAYGLLRVFTRLRRIDRATVAGYYGSDSAGTFVTCLGVLGTVHIAFDAYMPVMLAVMEIPGCLVALYPVSKLRGRGMDARGNLPDEPGYDPMARPVGPPIGHDGHAHDRSEDEADMALERMEHGEISADARRNGFDLKLLHEVFLNPGLYLLFGGIVVGYISGLQGKEVTRADDNFFVELFQGVLCLFLLEMGMTASRKLRDLKTAGWGFIAFGLLAPNLFAAIGIGVAHAYAWATGTHLELGTYVLFSVLCGAASYIAVPAVQRLAIPEASPTLPLAASLGLTFSYNVTIGIPVYIEMAKAAMEAWPV